MIDVFTFLFIIPHFLFFWGNQHLFFLQHRCVALFGINTTMKLQSSPQLLITHS